MAGIHLPDIGKLGIHVATGVLDKKKVAPINMAEEARLKAFLNRVENEKHERIRVMKKELRRMKRRKRRIDQRLEDIGRSRTEPFNNVQSGKSVSHTKLPPILKSSPIAKKPRKTITIREGEEITITEDSNKGLTSKTTIFPIQDELENSSSNSDKSSIALPSLSSSQKVKNVHQKRGKNSTDHSSRRISKDRKTSNESSSTIKKKTSAALTTDNEIKEESCSNNIDEQEVTVEDATLALGFDARGILPRKLPQQSLEDALNAIKACRYIRTPSRLQDEQEDDIKSQE